MDWVKQIWDWLKQPEIAGAVAAIAAVAGVAWAVYAHFSKRNSPKTNSTHTHASRGDISARDITTTASDEGIAIGIAGAPVTININKYPLAAKALETLEQQLKKAELREQEYQDQIKALTESVTALAKKKELPDAPAGIGQALEQLAEGNTAAAEIIFRDVAEKKEAEGRTANQEAAEAFRHLGALAFLHDTNKALDAYRRATELDPENPEGWNQLGHLLRRKGELQSAESAYRKVAELGESSSDRVLLAVAYGNLGIVYETHGDLDQAEAMHKKSLALEEALGRKEGMANQYGNLGIVYQIRGDLDQAEAMHKQSLALDEALGRKEGMANQYGNLGIVYRIRGDLDQAEAMFNKALGLFQAVGATPQVKQIQGLLDKLKNP